MAPIHRITSVRRGAIWPPLAALAAIGLGACSITVSEAGVFAPPEARAAGDAPGLEREARLTSVEAAPAKLAPYVPASLTHETRALGGRPIALTHIAAAGGDAGRPLIVNCGGNASDRRTAGVFYAEKILPFGDVVLFDYPGYGDSGGAARIADLLAAAPDMAAYLDGLGADRPLIFWGHSLGGFICADLAARSAQADALVLEATAPNARQVAEAQIPWWAPFMTVRIQESLKPFDIPAMLAGFDGPVLVLGAGKDTVLSARLARSVAETLRADGRRVTYLEFPDAGHSTIGAQPDFPDRSAAFFAAVTDAGAR